MNRGLLQNSAWSGPLILALQKAIVAGDLDAEDWRELGYLTGTQDYISGHDRLLRSLSWSDPDYGDCVFQYLRYLTTNLPMRTTFFIEHPKIFPLLEQNVPNQLSELGYGISHVPAVLPSVSASDVVRRALADADSLLATSGAPSTIDRLHTALHGYVRSACKDQGILLAHDASITASYKALRKEHPRLRVLGEHDSEVGKILSSFASVIDALNPLRNHGSVAHPNDQLIGQDEAVLVVNAVRTMFHYLNQKLGMQDFVLKAPDEKLVGSHLSREVEAQGLERFSAMRATLQQPRAGSGSLTKSKPKLGLEWSASPFSRTASKSALGSDFSQILDPALANDNGSRDDVFYVLTASATVDGRIIQTAFAKECDDGVLGFSGVVGALDMVAETEGPADSRFAENS